MASDFNPAAEASVPHEGWMEELPVESERFRFYKVRVHGVLQLVKTPKPAYARDLVTLESLRKEFGLCYGLSHASLPRYYALEADRLYEEYIEGDTLRSLIDSSDPRLKGPEFLAGICRQLLEVLEYIHGHGIIHLDIKPENVIITSLGAAQLKLIDFGSAVSAESSSTPGFTPGYMAPEQAGGELNFYTDIYQAGLLMQELAKAGGMEKKWKKFVAGSTAPDASDRFESCAAAIASIPNLPTAQKAGRGIRVAFLTLSTVIVGLIGALIWSMLENREMRLKEAAAGIEAPTSTARDTVVVIERHSEASAPLPAASAPAPAPASRQDKLRKEIEKSVKTYYSNAFSAVCSHPRRDAEGKLLAGVDSIYNETAVRTYNRCLAYGKTLAEKNPEEKDFIEEELMRTMQTMSSLWLERFFQ